MSDIEHRRSRIGGSDVPKILNLSPWGGPMDVYLDKLGLTEPAPQSRRMQIGLFAEPTIAALYEYETGHTLAQPPELYHPEHPWLAGHIDRITLGGDLLVELKTVEPWYAEKFGEPGTDQVPPQYLLQCATYMAISGFERCDLALLVGLSDFRIYHLCRDRELEGLMLESCAQFWTDHIVAQQPPALDASPATQAYLAARYPTHTDLILDADQEASTLTQELRSAKGAYHAAEIWKRRVEGQLKAKIGPSLGIVGEDFRVTWKRTKSSLITAWDQAALTLLAEQPWSEDDKAQFLRSFTTEKPGHRRFLAHFDGLTDDDKE